MAVHVVLRVRSGEVVSIPLRLLFRVYLYLISLISMIILVSGAASLGEAGLAVVLGKDFSYTPKHIVDFPRPVRSEAVLEAPPEPEDEERGLDRVFKEGLLNGISLTIVGALSLGLHTWGRRRLETKEERRGMLYRGYLILLLVIFGMIALFTLPSAIFGTLGYYILDTTDGFSRGAHPGGSLATAIISLPVWAYYLNLTVRLLRRQET